MDNLSRYRGKIWLVLCLFFVCWYFVIHNVKWYKFSPPTTVFRRPVDDIDSTTTYLAAARSGNDDEKQGGGGGGSDEKTNLVSIDGEIDWVHDEAQVRALEKELEPVLQKFKPKPMEKKKQAVIDKEFEDERKPKPKERRVNETLIDRVAEQMGGTLTRRSACSGRYIYVHKLPSRFNDDILEDCRSFNKWQDMCPSIDNMGLGPKLGNPQRVFSKSGWYSTNQFLLEVIFRNRMKQYECLTNDSSIASAVYVPYYAGLDVSRYLFDHNTSSRDALSLDLAEWLHGRPEWKTRSGKDHFLVAGRIIWDFRREIDDDDAWGNKLMVLPELKNMTILTIEKSPWHNDDFGIPYPTYFHPRNDNEIVEWQNKIKRQKRRSLFCFAGAPRPKMEDSIRNEIIEQCVASPRKCRLLQCSYGNLRCQQPVDVMKLFQSSIFCLQPPGDSYTRRSTFDSILAGCIPVFFNPGSAYIQYLWHLPREFEKYSVFIDEDDVKVKNVSIDKILSRISTKKVSEMREKIIELIPNLVYADPRSKLEKFNDAFDLSVKGVLKRMDYLSKNTSSLDFDQKFSWKYLLFGSVQNHKWDRYFRYSMNHKVKKQTEMF
ncbi:Exostosin-like protein [Cynara cardunculus var. scolymus]|uniref:Exostosin-like protein n=1 Tax=Cynara cardunculus var. scolymus TaxID=59895 RepID=A0A103Y6W9_CYNCS|nr:Exostosin-like protein [Cynara cardunculus var. scolymus]